MTVIDEVPEAPTVVWARYESRGLLKVADASVSVAALTFVASNELAIRSVDVRDKDKKTIKTPQVLIILL